ncbi:LysR family transcriptional regulator [Tsukamurella soli]|uniref:LysR family transcriptional regulator n=1 Tax=Tsukamurella soli TaxID=644556 RepID=A0ABP8K8I0_9ACTN
MPSDLPDLKLIRVFVAIVRNQGFAAAQQELGLSVQAISTYMAQLERRLGIVLCQRGRAGFTLTSKGEVYHQECLRILGELEQFERYGLALQGELRGTLTLGVLDSTVSDPKLPLIGVIGALSRDHPAVHLNVEVRSPTELQARVLDGVVDLGIGSFATSPPALATLPLYQEQHWLYCSSAHPLYDRRRPSPDVIAQQRMVTRGYWTERELARHGFGQKAATVDNMEAQLMLILSGGFIGYLPEHYADRWVDDGRLKPLLPASFGYQAPFSVIHRRGRMREPLVLTACELIRAAME